MMNTRHIAAVTVLLVAAVVPVANADIINVPGDQPTIQAGIDAAMNGDEIVVAEGSYLEAIDFSGLAITVRSTDPTDPMVVVNTVIDGTGNLHVVQCVSGEGSDTVLDGFTITGGSANGVCCGPDTNGGGMFNENSSPTVTNCTFTGNLATDRGGGMANDGSSPTVTDCIFSDNSAFRGGGMHNINASNPMVTGCTFNGNSVTGGEGGGMFNDNSSPTVTNCTFTANSTRTGFGLGLGGGMFNRLGSSPTVTNCAFSDNSALNGGGGMHNRQGSSPTVTNCTFSGNSAGAGGGMQSVINSNPVVTDCTFSENTVDGNGGGMSNDNSDPTVINCTFSGNSAARGGGIYTSATSLTVTDCTFCNNSPEHIDGQVVLSGQIHMSTFCPIPVCPGDITGDGEVGIVDFLQLLAAWGPCP